MSFIKKFSAINHKAVDEAGGKNASLGETFNSLTKHKINIPDGFATTEEAYWKFIDANNLQQKIEEQLSSPGSKGFSNLKDVGQKLRKAVMNAKMPNEVADAIRETYREMKSNRQQLDVAVHSSATAKDLPEASFAGQHKSFLNVRGKNNVGQRWQKQRTFYRASPARNGAFCQRRYAKTKAIFAEN